MNKEKDNTSKNTQESDYKLKRSAVDRLIEAHHGDASGVNIDEIKEKNRNNFLSKIPTWIKAVLIKWWFVGAFCFFFLWGLGNYITNQWDIILVMAIATGLLTNLLTDNFFRLLETSDKEYDFYMMFPTKKLWALFAYIPYALVITFSVVKTYDLINIIIINSNPSIYQTSDVPLGVEPILYGLIYLIYDLILIMIKNLVIKIIKRTKEEKNV